MELKHKPLYQPWNDEEFVSDIRVRSMNHIQRWIYRTLLQAAFFCPNRPNLPDNDDLLWMLAGCRNKNEWDKFKKPILDCFSKIEVDGIKLLWNKRVNADWERIVNKREELSIKARTGGLARAKQMLSERSADASHTLNHMPREEKRSKEREESKVSKVNLEKAQTPEARISILAKERFGQVEEKSFFKKDLRALSENHTQDEILAAFEFWLSNSVYTGKYPVSAFCRVAESLMSSGSITPEVNPDVQYVLDKSGVLSDNTVVFSPRHYPLLAKMVMDYGKELVYQAFTEFYSQIQNDENALKYATKDFVEKGPQFLRIIKIRLDEAKKQADLINRLAEEGRKKAEQEIAETERKMREEQELAENDMQEFFGVTNDSK